MPTSLGKRNEFQKVLKIIKLLLQKQVKLPVDQNIKMQRHISNLFEHLRYSFFAELVTGEKLLTILAKKKSIVDIRLSYQKALLNSLILRL